MPERLTNLNCAYGGGKLEVYNDNSAIKAAVHKNSAVVTGGVFYTKQSAAKLETPGETMCLGYGPLESEDLGTTGLSDREVGNLAVATLAADQWDGDTERNTQVLVEA